MLLPQSQAKRISNQSEPAPPIFENSTLRGLENMSFWNYRIVKLKHKDKKYKDESLGIYEVFYNDKGQPWNLGKNPEGSIIYKSWGKPFTVKKLKKEFEMHSMAFEKSILNYPKDFAKEDLRRDDDVKNYVSVDVLLKKIRNKKGGTK